MRQASRIATTSAWAVGSLERVTWLAPEAITMPSFTTRAAKGQPPRRTLATAISMACCMKELDIRGEALGFDQAGADGITDHAGGFVDAKLFEDPATVRVGGF